jgi:hypothetical protein
VTKRPAPQLLDLSQFASVDDALAKIAARQRYVDLGESLNLVGVTDVPTTLPIMFWHSMLTRSEGLHGAIVREIRHENPHAAFPLLRAFAEDLALVIYVDDHPRYVKTLTQRQSEIAEGDPKRKTVKALIDHASKHAPGLAAVYAELSEIAHFGAAAMWASHTIDGDQHSTWSSSPRFRSEEQALIACGYTLELSDGMVFYLRAFAIRHLLPVWGSRRRRADTPNASQRAL